MTRDVMTAGRPNDLVAALEADLVALAAAEADLERDAEAAERTRIERSAISLPDRLRGTSGPVEVHVPGGRYGGQVRDVGADWLLIGSVHDASGAGASEHLVALAHVLTVRGLGRVVVPAGGRVRRTAASVLRRWCRDRSQISVLLVDGSVVRGRAAASYADHLEGSVAGDAVAVPLVSVAVVSR